MQTIFHGNASSSTIIVFFSTDGIPNFLFLVSAMVCLLAVQSLFAGIEDYVGEFCLTTLTSICIYMAVGILTASIAISRNKVRVQTREQEVLID